MDPTGSFDVPLNMPAAASMGSTALIVQLVLYVFFAYCLFALAKKMNVANAWFAFIPLLNIYLMVTMAGKPGWWVILFFIPIVDVVIAIMVVHAVVVKRGHTALFTLGMIFLSIIFLPILAFESKTV
jgi:hypothetical protein